ncbi:lamin tail domain-containing protein [Flammeovirgaceae bacterium SG7u.111]|nr:lamin tail domain-containing protein [Flammeovirgaceae bacterium SG7u.132]WPO35382.1 lamin tail domain-containing protein [Flammeovirgaceae bacterium SG7u.111]
MKKAAYFIAILSCLSLAKSNAQLLEDFNRINLENGSTVYSQGGTSGLVGGFLIENNELRAIFDNGSGTRKGWISTSQNLDFTQHIVHWKFNLKLDFSNLSSSLVTRNLARVYLISDSEDLNEDLDGYYVEARLEPSSSGVAYHLYKQTGSSRSELVFDGEGVLSSAQEFAEVEVIRKPDGVWELYVNNSVQGEAVDEGVGSGNYFGIQVHFSSGAREDKFYFDDVEITKYPFPLSANAVSGTELELVWSTDLNKPQAENMANYLLNDSIVPASVAQDISDPRKVVLVFEKPFLENGSSKLEIENMTDIEGSYQPDSLTYQQFFYYSKPDEEPPKLLKISGLEGSELIIEFDEALREAEAVDKSNYSVDNFFSYPQSLVFSGENSLNLVFSEPFEIEEGYTLYVRNLSDTLGNRLINTDSLVFNFADTKPPDLIKAELVTSSAVDIYFSEEVDSSSASTLINFYEVEMEENAIAAVRDENDRSLVHLFFPQPFSENKTLTLQVSNVEDVYGNAMPLPQEVEFFRDTKRPSVDPDQVFATEGTMLKVVFTEPVDSLSARIVNFYELGPDIGHPFQAVRDSLNPAVVWLSFKNSLQPEQPYNLKITGVKDEVGNTMYTRNRSVVYDEKPPELLGLRVKNDSVLALIFSEELSDSVLLKSNRFTLNTTDYPTTISKLESASNKVELGFPTIFQANNRLLLLEMEDLQGNLVDSIAVEFEAQFPAIFETEVLSENSLRIWFSKQITFPGSIHAFVSSSVADSLVQANSQAVDFHFPQSFEEDSLQTVWVKNVIAGDGKKVDSLSETFVYHNFLLEAKVIAANILEVIYEEELDAEIEAYLFEVAGAGKPLNVVVNEEEPEIVTLFFAKPFKENIPYKLRTDRVKLATKKLAPASEISFEWDTSPPSLDTLILKGRATLLLTFSEPLNETSAKAFNHFAFQQIGYPQEVELFEDSLVELLFEEEVEFGKSYNLVVEGVADLDGNVMEQDTFLVNIPQKVSVNNLLISELMVDPSPSQGLPEVEYLELYNPTDDTLSLLSVALQDASKKVSLPHHLLPPKSYLLICPKGKETEFSIENCLGISSFPSLTNSGETISLVTVDDSLISSVFYSSDWYGDDEKSDGGWSLEMIDLETKCGSGAANWRASEGSLGGTPGRVNSVNGVFVDTLAPQIVSWELVLNGKIGIIFSEEIDSLVLSSKDNFLLENEKVDSALLISPIQVETIFPQALDSGRFYKFKVQGISDCVGNVLVDSFLIGLGKIPQIGGLLITEVMADESPSVGLSETEYIELYNSTDSLLNLGGMVLNDGNGSAEIPDYLLPSKSYVLVCKNGKETEFGIENVLGISSFPSLTNAGKTLSLSNPNGVTVFSVSYSDNWYGDDGKSNGGWSLEMIDLETKCGNGAANWRASEDVLGGTPGRINSVNGKLKDEEPYVLQSYRLISPDTLELVFSEAPDSLLISTPNFVFDPYIFISDLKVDGQVVKLFLRDGLEKGSIYELKLTSIYDCWGNVLDSASVILALGEQPNFQELLITEVLADPIPAVGLPEYEYLELYNSSDKIITLEGCSLSDEKGKVILPKNLLLPKQYLILCPANAVFHFQGFGEVMGVPSWLSLNNDGEELSLENRQGELVFSIVYSKSWYADSEKAEGGWSLEMVDLEYPCYTSENWAGSVDDKGGTPGSENSVKGIVSDHFPPKFLKLFVKDSLNLEVVFDENLDSLSVMNAEYEFKPSLKITSVGYISAESQKVNLQLGDEILPSQEYTFSVKGLQDCAGNTDMKGQKITFRMPEKAESNDVLISEVLFNPKTGGVDFVEIYNYSNKYIDLKKWELATQKEGEVEQEKVLSESSLIFLPRSFLVLTSDKNIFKSEYPTVPDSILIEMKMPSFNDDEGNVILLDSSRLVIDEMNYDENMHFSLLHDVGGVSLERIAYDLPSSDPENWHSAAATEGYATPGKPNSQRKELVVENSIKECFEVAPEIFTPNLDGVDDFATIRFNCSSNAQVASIIIYDLNGRAVKVLIQNALLGQGSYFRWDGTNDEGQKVRTGYYLVFIELFDLQGNVHQVKKKLAVGSSGR